MTNDANSTEKDSGNIRLVVYVPVELHRRLAAAAQWDDRSMASVVRRALVAFLGPECPEEDTDVEALLEVSNPGDYEMQDPTGTGWSTLVSAKALAVGEDEEQWVQIRTSSGLLELAYGEQVLIRPRRLTR